MKDCRYVSLGEGRVKRHSQVVSNGFQHRKVTMKCILHIGTEKTGTKTLQRFLDVNRRKLASRRILVSRAAGVENNFGLPVLAYHSGRRDDLTRQLAIRTEDELRAYGQRLFAALDAEVAGGRPHTIICSSEHFQSRLTEVSEIQRLHESLVALGCTEFVTVVYLRRPAELANSLFSTAFRSGHDMKSLPTPEHHYVRNLCDHRATLSRWITVFGKQSLLPRLFDKTAFVQGSLIEDFATIAGIDSTGLRSPRPINESLSAVCGELLHRTSMIVAEQSPRAPLAPIDDIIAAIHLSHGRGRPYRMPQHLNADFDSAFAQSDEWVRRHFFPARAALWSTRLVESDVSCGVPTSTLDRVAERMANACMRRGWCRRREDEPSLPAQGVVGRACRKLQSLRRRIALARICWADLRQG